MRRLLLITISLWTLGGPAGCGLADDPREEAKRHEYLTFTDPAFAAWCVRTIDADANGRISRYEAERVVAMDCRDNGIESLDGIGNFTSLRELDCRDNRLTELDLRGCPNLTQVDCSFNRLRSLDINGLRSLTRLDCAQNQLEGLDLISNASLRTLRCNSNPLKMLSAADCATTMEEVDARDCPLEVFYKNRGQEIRLLQLDDPQVVREL